jgi:hypothetical protein
MEVLKKAGEHEKLYRSALSEITDMIAMYPAQHLDFDSSYDFSSQVRDCYGANAVRRALVHSVISVSKFCALVMQRRVSNGPLKEEFRRLQLEPVWRATHTHSIETFLRWVYSLVMEGADETVVVDNLYRATMRQNETVQEFARRIEVLAAKAASVSKGEEDYFRVLPFILVKGLFTEFRGWNLQNLVKAELEKSNLAYLEREIGDSRREQHWISVRSLAIAVAKNCPVAAKSSSYREAGMNRSSRPYMAARQAAESVHSDRAAAANPVGTLGPSDPPAGASRRIPFRSSRSKSPFRSNTERGCFNCGKEGHLQAECPAPR